MTTIAKRNIIEFLDWFFVFILSYLSWVLIFWYSDIAKVQLFDENHQKNRSFLMKKITASS